MKTFQIKKIITSLWLSLFFVLPFLSAQLEWGTHFMNNSLSQSNMSNPALFSDFNASITMPSIYTGFSNSSFSFHEVITHDKNVLRLNMDEVLNRVGPKGLIIQNNISIESFGMNFQNENFLFNLHHGVRVFNQTHFSKEMLQMVWGGNEQFIDETIDFGIQQNMLAYHEIGLGLGFKINRQLTIGTRLKYLKGLATIQTPRSVATIYTNPEFYQLDSETDYLVQTGGFPDQKLEDISPFEFENYDRSIFGGNSGFAFDVGMTYRLNKKLTLEASINNIGFIKWKENAYDHESKGGYQFDGLDLKPLVEGGEISTDEIIDSVTNIFQFQDTESTFKTSTPANGYLSVRYELSKRLYLNSFLFMEKNNSISNYAGGVNLKKDFGTIWTLGVQYAYHDKSAHNIGLMTSLRLGPFQFYATTDNIAPILDPLKTQKFNFRTGLNLVFGNKVKKKRKRQEELLLVNTQKDTLAATMAFVDSLLRLDSNRVAIQTDEILPTEEELLTNKEKENTSSLVVENKEATAQQKRKAAAEEQKKLEQAKALLAQKEQKEAEQKRKKAAEEQKKLEAAKALLAQKEQQEAEQKRRKAAEEQKQLEKEKALLAQKEQQKAEQKRKATAEEQKRLEAAKTQLTAKGIKTPHPKKETPQTTEKEEPIAIQKMEEDEGLKLIEAAKKKLEQERKQLEEERKKIEKEKTLLAERKKLEEEKKRREAAILLQQQQAAAAQAERERQQKIAEQNSIQRTQQQNNRPSSNFGTYIIIKKTSLREEATSSSKVLRRLKLATEVIVLEKTSKYWWKVDLNGRIGYVKAATLEQ